ncbi:MAG: hypothetical protein OXR66_04570 [Candidatus Woesearchaeota archaeon]|nr:hypothetical protein [Candidatus Woesearchaeota archaeon]
MKRNFRRRIKNNIAETRALTDEQLRYVAASDCQNSSLLGLETVTAMSQNGDPAAQALENYQSDIYGGDHSRETLLEVNRLRSKYLHLEERFGKRQIGREEYIQLVMREHPVQLALLEHQRKEFEPYDFRQDGDLPEDTQAVPMPTPSKGGAE